jgi:hypothetical protein
MSTPSKFKRVPGRKPRAPDDSAEQTASELVGRCTRAAKLEVWRRKRIVAYVELGRHLNREMGDTRAGWYGDELVSKFVESWNRANGTKLTVGVVKYARLVARYVSPPLLTELLDAGVSWTALRELSRRGLHDDPRRGIVEDLRAGSLRPSQIAAEVQARLAANRKGQKASADHVGKALRVAKRHAVALQRTLKQLSAALDDSGALQHLPEAGTSLDEAGRLAQELAERLGKLKAKTRRRRGKAGQKRGRK